jgi:hypothetical protein
MLEHNDKPAFASPFRISPVRNFTIMEEPEPIAFGEVSAPIREYVVRRSQLVGWDWGQRGLFPNSLARIAGGCDKQKIRSAHPLEKGAEGSLRLVPGGTDLLARPAEIIDQHYDIPIAQPIRIVLVEHCLAEQRAPIYEELIERLSVEPVSHAEMMEHRVAALSGAPGHRSKSPISDATRGITVPPVEGGKRLTKGRVYLRQAKKLNDVENPSGQVPVSVLELV